MKKDNEVKRRHTHGVEMSQEARTSKADMKHVEEKMKVLPGKNSLQEK